MSLRRLWVAVQLTAMEVLRGRLVLLLVVLVPSLFYLVAWLTTGTEPVAFELGSIAPDRLVTVAKRDEAAVFIGLAATGLLTSFIALKLMQREADVTQRLVLCGYRAVELVAARLVVLLAVVVVVALYVSAALPLVFFDPQRFLGVWLGFCAVGWVYGCYGLLVGALIRRELEGILFVALLTNLDAGWLQNPIWYAEASHTAVIRGLPAHLPAQVSMAAAFTSDPLGGPLAGAFAYGLGLLCLALLSFAWRMRRR